MPAENIFNFQYNQWVAFLTMARDSSEKRNFLREEAEFQKRRNLLSGSIQRGACSGIY
jgi:hypothetical protein